MELKTFWFVWNEDGNAPRYKHCTEGAATTEAERLAHLHPGQTFVVLEAKCARTIDRMQRVEFRPDGDIPF